jgi:positive regulator of sigma E activity
MCQTDTSTRIGFPRVQALEQTTLCYLFPDLVVAIGCAVAQSLVQSAPAQKPNYASP